MMTSLFRNERDHYGFNTRYENRSRERTPPGTYGSPIGDRDTRPNDQSSHDPWHTDPRDGRSHDPRDDPRSHSNDPRDRKPGWEDRQAEDDRYGYSKSYNDEPYQVRPGSCIPPDVPSSATARNTILLFDLFSLIPLLTIVFTNPIIKDQLNNQ